MGGRRDCTIALTLLTAWEGLFEGLGLKPLDDANFGKTLLILPGAGGVGSLVIQLAKKLAGLTVIATASRPESQAAVLALGADVVINHRSSAGPLKEQLEAKGISIRVASPKLVMEEAPEPAEK